MMQDSKLESEVRCVGFLIRHIFYFDTHDAEKKCDNQVTCVSFRQKTTGIKLPFPDCR